MAACLFGFCLMLAGVIMNRFTRWPLAAFLVAASGSAILSVCLILDIWRTVAGG